MLLFFEDNKPKKDRPQEVRLWKDFQCSYRSLDEAFEREFGKGNVISPIFITVRASGRYGTSNWTPARYGETVIIQVDDDKWHTNQNAIPNIEAFAKHVRRPVYLMSKDGGRIHFKCIANKHAIDKTNRHVINFLSYVETLLIGQKVPYHSGSKPVFFKDIHSLSSWSALRERNLIIADTDCVILHPNQPATLIEYKRLSPTYFRESDVRQVSDGFGNSMIAAGKAQIYGYKTEAYANPPYEVVPNKIKHWFRYPKFAYRNVGKTYLLLTPRTGDHVNIYDPCAILPYTEENVIRMMNHEKVSQGVFTRAGLTPKLIRKKLEADM